MITFVALAHMVDATSLTLVVALAHMVDATYVFNSSCCTCTQGGWGGVG